MTLVRLDFASMKHHSHQRSVGERTAIADTGRETRWRTFCLSEPNPFSQTKHSSLELTSAPICICQDDQVHGMNRNTWSKSLWPPDNISTHGPLELFLPACRSCRRLSLLLEYPESSAASSLLWSLFVRLPVASTTHSLQLAWMGYCHG